MLKTGKVMYDSIVCAEFLYDSSSNKVISIDLLEPVHEYIRTVSHGRQTLASWIETCIDNHYRFDTYQICGENTIRPAFTKFVILL